MSERYKMPIQMSVNLKLFNSYVFLCAFHVFQFHKQTPDANTVISLFTFSLKRGKMNFMFCWPCISV